MVNRNGYTEPSIYFKSIFPNSEIPSYSGMDLDNIDLTALSGLEEITQEEYDNFINEFNQNK